MAETRDGLADPLGGLCLSHSGRVLVVDDEVNARSALADLLRDEGFEVETAADAFKALGKYEVPVKLSAGVTATLKFWVVGKDK